MATASDPSDPPRRGGDGIARGSRNCSAGRSNVSGRGRVRRRDRRAVRRRRNPAAAQPPRQRAPQSSRTSAAPAPRAGAIACDRVRGPRRAIGIEHRRPLQRVPAIFGASRYRGFALTPWCNSSRSCWTALAARDRNSLRAAIASRSEFSDRTPPAPRRTSRIIARPCMGREEGKAASRRDNYRVRWCENKSMHPRRRICAASGKTRFARDHGGWRGRFQHGARRRRSWPRRVSQNRSSRSARRSRDHARRLDEGRGARRGTDRESSVRPSVAG